MHRCEPIREEARRLWTLYRSVVHPDGVTRLGLRYINRLDIPEAPIELKDYLRTVPEISPDLPQIVSHYYMQVVIPMDDLAATAIVNQTLLPSSSPSATSILLDIDLFRQEDLPDDEEGIWDLCEKMRAGKNRISQACITERTKELIR